MPDAKFRKLRNEDRLLAWRAQNVLLARIVNDFVYIIMMSRKFGMFTRPIWHGEVMLAERDSSMCECYHLEHDKRREYVSS